MISVIIPVYNVENYLVKCLDSIVSQTYKDLEILLVDDGSTDLSGTICDEYASKDSRIRVIHKKNGGVSSARNLGLDEAVGEYIGFIDSDDVISDNYFWELYMNAKQNDSSIVCCDLVWLKDNLIIQRSSSSKKIIMPIEQVNNCFFVSGYVKDLIYGPCNKIIKSNLAKKYRFDTTLRLGEDLLYMFNLLQEIDNVTFINSTCYYYIMRSDSAVHTKNFSKQLEYLKATDRILEICNEKSLNCTELCLDWRYIHILNFLFSVTKNKKYIDGCVNYYYDFKKKNRKRNFKHLVKRIYILTKGRYMLNG